MLNVPLAIKISLFYYNTTYMLSRQTEQGLMSHQQILGHIKDGLYSK